MSNKKQEKLTTNLVTPTCKKEFSKDWARRIIVDYMKKTDPDWLLASVLKVLDVFVKDNPHPGKTGSRNEPKKMPLALVQNMVINEKTMSFFDQPQKVQF